jgi:hypothetical protein
MDPSGEGGEAIAVRTSLSNKKTSCSTTITLPRVIRLPGKSAGQLETAAPVVQERGVVSFEDEAKESKDLYSKPPQLQRVGL